MQISKLKTDLTNKSQTCCHKCQNSAEHRGHFASLYPIYYITEYGLLSVYNNRWHLLTVENKSSKDNETEKDKWKRRGTERDEMERESMIDTVSEQTFLMDSYGWSWRLIHHWAHATASQQEKAYWRTTCQPFPQRPTATRSQRWEHAPEEAVWSQRETENVTVQANETSLL